MDLVRYVYLLVAAPALDVLLAEANAALGIAGWRIVMGATRIAATWLASMGSELEVVVGASIALVARHTGLALALALAVALQRTGSDGIAATVDAVGVVAHIEVLLAALAVGSITIVAAIQAVAAMTRLIEQMRIEVTFVRKPVAVASCKWTNCKMRVGFLLVLLARLLYS